MLVSVWHVCFSWRGVQISRACLLLMTRFQREMCFFIGCPHQKSIPPTSFQLPTLRLLRYSSLHTFWGLQGCGVGRCIFAYWLGLLLEFCHIQITCGRNRQTSLIIFHGAQAPSSPGTLSPCSAPVEAIRVQPSSFVMQCQNPSSVSCRNIHLTCLKLSFPPFLVFRGVMVMERNHRARSQGKYFAL